jgi:putative N6-adenine-specific DNA methylase
LSPKRLPGNSQARSDSQGNERKEHVDRSSPRKEYNAAEPQRVSIPPEVGKGQQKHRIRYFPPNKLNTFIVCHPGLEPYLSQELSALGLQHTAAVGGAQLTHPATSEDLLNCHLYLGTATQVLIRCGDTFAARGLPELRRKVEKLPWNEILRDDVQLKIRVSSSKSLLMHSTAIRDRVVEGIYGVLGREVPDAKELEETSENAVPLTVRVSRDRVQISIDSSLTPMHQRGYRLETGKAPLREDLAYAFLLAAGWKPLPIHGRQDSQEASMYNAFLDPFCGSGTIPIEAASMASGLPPGRLLSAPFRGTHLHDPDSWEKLVMKALKKSAGIESTVQISASDRDKGGLEITKSNAKRAGVLGMIDVQHCAFSGHPWLEDAANTPDRMLMAANLPFGRRVSPLGSKDRIKQFLPLHQTLATRFGDLSDAGRQFTAILLTDDPVLVRRGGYKTGLNIKFSTKHGGIPVSAMLTMGSGGAPPVETKQIEQESAIDASV